MAGGGQIHGENKVFITFPTRWLSCSHMTSRYYDSFLSHNELFLNTGFRRRRSGDLQGTSWNAVQQDPVGISGGTGS